MTGVGMRANRRSGKGTWGITRLKFFFANGWQWHGTDLVIGIAPFHPTRSAEIFAT